MNWISVKEQLPEDGKFILVSYTSLCPFSNNIIRSSQTSHYNIVSGFSWKPHKGYKETITHWMPLPEGPDELD